VGCYRTAWGTWFVQIRWQGERYYLGTCETVEEAVELRDAFLKRMSAEIPDGDVA
jgi:AP2 domain